MSKQFYMIQFRSHLDPSAEGVVVDDTTKYPIVTEDIEYLMRYRNWIEENYPNFTHWIVKLVPHLTETIQ